MKENLKNEIKERLTIMGVAPMFRKQAVNGDVIIFERQNEMFSDVHYSLKLNKTQEPYIDLALKVEELKLKCNLHTYLIQLTHMEFGDVYSFFYVPLNEEELWTQDKEDLRKNISYAYAYNVSEPMYSEFGLIGFRKGNMGGIVRTY